MARSKIFRSPMLFVITRPYQVVLIYSRPSSSEALKVDPRGFEPLTFWLPARPGSTVCRPGKPQVTNERSGRCYSLWCPNPLNSSRNRTPCCYRVRQCHLTAANPGELEPLLARRSDRRVRVGMLSEAGERIGSCAASTWTMTPNAGSMPRGACSSPLAHPAGPGPVGIRGDRLPGPSLQRARPRPTAVGGRCRALARQRRSASVRGGRSA